MKDIQFTEEPNRYDSFGAPHYYSKCGKFRILHVRTGWVDSNGKCPWESWYAHYKQGKKWYGIPGLPFESKWKAKWACRHFAKTLARRKYLNDKVHRKRL